MRGEAGEQRAGEALEVLDVWAAQLVEDELADLREVTGCSRGKGVVTLAGQRSTLSMPVIRARGASDPPRVNPGW